MHQRAYPLFSKMDVHEDETLDDLQLKGLWLIQKRNGFRLCLDSVLLSDFARIRPGDAVVDLGTGTGALMMLLWGKNKGKTFCGIEIQPELAEAAERNIRGNHLDSCMRILCCDAAEAPLHLPRQSIDAIVCNPPYPFLKGDRGEAPSSRDVSRHQNSEGVQPFLSAARQLLKERGKLFCVYPASEMLPLLQALRENRMEPKRIRFVHSTVKKPAILVLIEAVNGGKPSLQTQAPLILQEENGKLDK